MYQDVGEYTAFIGHFEELIEYFRFECDYYAVVYFLGKLHLYGFEFVQIVGNVMGIPELRYFFPARGLIWNSASTLLIHSVHLVPLDTNGVLYD